MKKIILFNIILTKPQSQRTASTIPAVKDAQFKLPLSFGTETNLFTKASFSII